LRVSIDGQNVTGEHRPETEEREPVEEFPLLASPSGNTGPPRLFPTGNDQAFNIKNKSMNVMVNDTVILDNSNDQDFNNNDNAGARGAPAPLYKGSPSPYTPV
jgi:hypothetical protein